MRLPVLKNSGQEDKTRKSGFVSLANGPAAIICYLCSVCVCYTGRFVGWVLARPFLSLFPLLYINYDFCIVAPTRQERHTTLRGEKNGVGGSHMSDLFGSTFDIYIGGRKRSDDYRVALQLPSSSAGWRFSISTSCSAHSIFWLFNSRFQSFFFHWKSVSVIYCPFK